MPDYRVIADFNDIVAGQPRKVGDIITADLSRAKRLAAAKVIELDDAVTPDDTGLVSLGGGYYQLPNGDKVQGKDKALEALKQLVDLRQVEDEANGPQGDNAAGQ